MIISILNQKGGVGKTTISVNLSHCYHLRGFKTLLVDSDSQASARHWHEKSNGEILDLIALDRPTLNKDVIKFRDYYPRIIIDGVAKLNEMTPPALICSDLVIIPVQPSYFDIWATKKTVDLAKERIEITNGKLKVYFLINGIFPNTIMGREVEGILQEYGLPVLKSTIQARQIYKKSHDKGETAFNYSQEKAPEAVQELNNLVSEIEEVCHGIA